MSKTNTAHARPWLGSTWIYLLVLVPTLTELLETGRLPSWPLGLTAHLALTVFVALLCHTIIKHENALVALSASDELTGLGNRRRFLEDLNQEVSKAHRLGSTLVLAYVDVDQFKAVNDALGHFFGDRCLLRVADLLVGSFRRTVDGCYRIGGDEFAVLTSSSSGEGDARTAKQVAEALAIASERLMSAVPFLTSLSIGVAALREEETADMLLKRADALMYADKKTKGARFSSERPGPLRTGAALVRGAPKALVPRRVTRSVARCDE